MSATRTYTGTLSVLTCSNCGVTFGLDKAFIKARRDDHKTWYCPNGCQRYYPQDNVEEQLRAQLAAEEGRVAAERAANARTRERLDHERRSHAATKGHLTRMRKRALAGVCPCCNRSFKQVREHMERQHPEQFAAVFGDAAK